jgi:RNA polymerase sigma factor (sigma-70 family)
MNNLKDDDIIQSVIRGNHNDFSLLIDRYKDKGFSLLRRMLRNHLDAEEVLQDCFLKAFNSLSQFRFESKFSTWFYRIVYNSAISFISSKRRKMEGELTSIEDLIELKDEPKIYAEIENTSKYITEVVNLLPPKYSAIINMFYMDEMSLDEISKVTGLSLVNVKVILHRSRNALRDLILKHNLQEELL